MKEVNKVGISFMTAVVFTLTFGFLAINCASAYSIGSNPKIAPQLVEYIQNLSIKSKSADQTGLSPFSIKSSQSQMVPVIITVFSKDDEDDIADILTEHGSKVKYKYELINAVAANVPYDYVQTLASNQHLKGLYLDKKIQVPEPEEKFEQEMQQLRKKGKFSPLLSQSTERIGTPFVWDNGIDGSGVKVAVLDTGIDKDYPGLRGKVIAERDFTLFDDKLDPSDGYGHGTHCAGIIAGSGANSSIFVDTSSTDASNLTNIPNPEVVPHVGIVELDDLYNVLVTKWVFNITPASEIHYGDLPGDWWGYDTSSYVYIEQADENYTTRINRDETQIYDLSIDRGNSWLSGTGSQSWGNYTLTFKTGVDGYVTIRGNSYGAIYLDKDGDFNTTTDQMKSFENGHFKKYYYWCYSWGCYGYWSSSIYMTFQVASNGNNLMIGLDTDWDYEPDLFKGVAPGVQLLNGKVLSDYGYGYDSGIIAGIEWAVLSGADVISMSLGGWENICDGNDPLSEAVEKAWDMGTVVVIAAGNSGWWGDETISTPGCARKVMTVGASSKYAQSEEIASFSSKGPTADGRIKPEILAPGLGIISTRAEGADMGYKYTPYYTSASGTSMATPHIAGVAALLKQANTDLTPDELKTYIMNGAEDFKESVFAQGAGLVNASKSYDLLDNPKILASPPKLDLVVQNKAASVVSLNTSLTAPSLSAFRDDTRIEDTTTEYDTVNSTTGFDYVFYIDDDVYSFNISITWNDSLNDVDMDLYDPSDYYYSGSYGVTNSESIYVVSPQAGQWRLEVYPCWVHEEVNVSVILKTYNLKEWNWFSYNASTGELKVNGSVSISGLYSGRIKLNSSGEEVTIPTSIIVSEPTEFKSYAVHEYFGDDVCGPDTSEGSAGPHGGAGGIPAVQAANANRIASFDGYFCDSMERRAFSFEVPQGIPYLDINVWIRNYETSSFNDFRLLVYDPDGKEYDASDWYGSMEWLYIYDPMPGNWTVVVESEDLYLTDNAGLQFSGEVWYPGMVIEPDYLWLVLKPNETFNTAMNISNFLDYDFYLRPLEANIWTEVPLTIVPNSEIEENQNLGPFGYSYRYYNFNVTDGTELLKAELSLSPDQYLDLELYIFDANGTLVARLPRYQYYFHYVNSIYDYVDLSDRYERGMWTAVVVGNQLYHEEYPFTLKISMMNKTAWNWATTSQPIDYFKGTKNMSVTINTPSDIEPGRHYASLYLNGDWYESAQAPHDTHRGTFTCTIPFTIYVAKPIIHLSLDINQEECKPDEEIIASAQLTNTEAYIYEAATGSVYWQISHDDNTTVISQTSNVQVYGGKSINITQTWRAGVLNPGGYTLTVVYNYTDYYGKNWIAKASKSFEVATANFVIPEQASVNISGAGTTLRIKVNETTNASVNVMKYANNPTNTTVFGMEELNKFVRIEVNRELENNLVWAVIKMYYTDDEVSAAGIDEGSLKMYYWNQSNGKWEQIENSGVNTAENHVWVNVTHFSLYSPFGNEQQPPPTTPPEDKRASGRRNGEGFGGVPPCVENWTCTKWSECIGGKQSRTCTDLNSCITEENRPLESQNCTSVQEEESVCAQVITPAVSPAGECKKFPTPCDVPDGWEVVDKCPPQGEESITGGVPPTGLVTGATFNLIVGTLILIAVISIGGLFYWIRIRK